MIFNQRKNILKKRSFRYFLLITKFQLLITALALSGCMGVYEGGFECPPGEGVGCKSISEVNQMVNEGDLPPKAVSNPPQTSCKQCGSNLDLQRNNIDPLEASRIWYSPWALGEV